MNPFIYVVIKIMPSCHIVINRDPFLILLLRKYCFILFIKVFNDIDLLGLKAPPKEPTRHGTCLAVVLFSKEELLDVMLPPVNTKLVREVLDPEKVLLIQSKYHQYHQ